MGVPGFFAWISAKFKSKIILTHINERPKYLYIDANCLFHPECFKVLDMASDVTDLEQLENLMFRRIINYLDYLEGVVNPTTMMFIAVDGVAPLAKINQQRKRRFKSIIDNKLRNEIKLKHGIKINDMWTNTVISPGTLFMEQLHVKLKNHYKSKSEKKNIEYIYSSYHTPGEGEHKLLQHIKSNTLFDDSIVIYGLDADLLFLALASKRTCIHLLREESQINGNLKKEELYDVVEDVAQELLFVSISGLKESYNEEILRLIKNNCEGYIDNEEDYSVDLIFMCFLLGNDFLPHFPSIDIHKGGLDQIINAYINCIIDVRCLLIEYDQNTIHINNIFLLRMILLLSENENKHFQEVLPKALEKSRHKRCYVNGDFARDLWNMENMRTVQVDDCVGLGIGETDEWKYRYYEHYFHVSEHQNLMIESLVKMYLEGIGWVAKYYFDKCPDWQWQYPYNNAPFISDLANYTNLINNINDVNFDSRHNIPIMTQLLSVLPPQCNNILPLTYRELMVSQNSPLIDLYPTHVKLDMLYKDLFWKCDPKLPPLDHTRVLELSHNLNLTKDETIRNTEYKEYKFKQTTKNKKQL